MTAFYRTIPDTPLLPFLERSPHIEVFAISFSCPDSGILLAMLKAMPTLTSLRVTARDSAIFDLLRLLSDSPTFLPHITNIALSLYTRVGWTDSQVKTWIDAVTSRREVKSTAQLLDFEFVLAWGFQDPVDDRIIACVSALKEEGMLIYVGGQLDEST